MAKSLRNRIDRSILQSALANQTGTLQAQEAIEAGQREDVVEPAPTAAPALPVTTTPPAESVSSSPVTPAASAAAAPVDEPSAGLAPSQITPSIPTPQARPTKRNSTREEQPTVTGETDGKNGRFPTRIDDQYYIPLQNARALLRGKGVKVSIMTLIDHALAYYLPLVQEKGELPTPRKKS